MSRLNLTLLAICMIVPQGSAEGGLFGVRERVQSRRQARVEARASNSSSGSCSNAATACSQQAVYVPVQAKVLPAPYQAPMQQAPSLPAAPPKVEEESFQTNFEDVSEDAFFSGTEKREEILLALFLN